MRLTLSEAQAVIEAVIADITSLEKVVGVTVVDVRGDPLAAARMDGAAFYTVDIARGKALVSAMFGKPSAEYEAAAGTPLMQQMSSFAGSPLVFRQGAVPLMKDGTVVGAVGVAGAASEEDERAALSGAATLSLS
jgi:uncharacterized protein GlcG (DUF336 family)